MRATLRESDHETAAPRPILKAPTALRILRKQIPITRTTFYREIADGTIRTSRMRGTILIDLEEIHRYTQKCTDQQE